MAKATAQLKSPTRLDVRQHAKYEHLIDVAKTKPPLRTAVAHPCDESSLSGTIEAFQAGLIKPILVGPAGKIRSIAEKLSLDISGLEIIDVPHSQAAAERAVALVREAKAELLMKGSLHSDEILGEVTKRDILGILDSVMKAGYPAAASRARAVLTAFFNWAIARDIIAASPCLGIKPPAETRSRDRVLSDDELRWLWTACEQDPFPFGRMVQLLILTGARRDEVRRITDKELKRADGLWVLPASRAKNRRAHEVPLSDAALAVIDTAPRVRNRAGYVFCTNGKTPSSGFSRMKRRLDRDMLKIAREEAKARGEDSQKVKIPEWVLHDLRRTAASGMARLGIALPVIERCLNHVSGSFAGIVGVYQKHSYIEEKKTALDTWARFVMSLTEPAAENVLPFKQAAK